MTKIKFIFVRRKKSDIETNYESGIIIKPSCISIQYADTAKYAVGRQKLNQSRRGRKR